MSENKIKYKRPKGIRNSSFTISVFALNKVVFMIIHIRIKSREFNFWIVYNSKTPIKVKKNVID